MGSFLSIITLIFVMIAGHAYGEPENPFIKENKDLYVEGWYQVDGKGKLTGVLVLDVINGGGSSELSRIDYSGVPDFDKCATKPGNWSCKYDSKTGILSFIVDSGTFGPNDDASFKVLYKNPLKKKLTDKGYVYYQSVTKRKGMTGLTRIESIR